ncbi:MAG: hypothetical protein NWF04_09755 [Candidatus Bathyarchaeota archaeon]|nr:hypothetical protein [Candidatus Bathyarchaeota archaeon]
MEANDKRISLLPNAKTTPPSKVKAPIAATKTIMNSFVKTTLRSTAPVAVIIADTKTTNPVKETKPPSAIFNRCLVEKVGIYLIRTRIKVRDNCCVKQANGK